MRDKLRMLASDRGQESKKVYVVASSKKTGPSKSKSAKTKAAESKIEDAVVIDDTAKSDDAPIENETVQDASDTETNAPETVTEPAAADEPASADETVAPDAEPVEKPAEPAPEPVSAAPVEEKRNTFLPLVLGGIIAGIIGFMASEMDFFGNGDADITTKLRNDLNTQQERLVALETAEPPAIEIPEVDLSPLEEQLTVLDARIAALEERPAIVVPEGVDADAAAAYAAELDALKSSVETQRDEIEALLNNAKSVEEAAAQAATAASAQTAIAKIVSAIDAGQPFPDAFADLTALDVGEIDPALGAVAADGVATLSTLQAEFPDQARTALATARASGVEEGQQGLGGFLKRSLGARSVAPREGDDPDAVLSRAEAAIKSGDLNATLTELDTLPEEAQAAIADWRAAADARVAARAAADALAQRLTAD
ncbi:hypothetical protein [uncultured Sulfitobacter sp.]|uniref:COG4223 family protein n=1 Tax=uncultured Sulfitobacter sp. TaxID=191468 RepID=UPI00262C455F|nr:hypothetical protein [uncultured Sulfitobacter sp.]